MMSRIKKALGTVVILIVAVSFLSLSAPKKAQAQPVAEYTVLITLIAESIITASGVLSGGIETAFSKVAAKIESDTQSASTANENGDDSQEVANLSAALGNCKALRAMIIKRVPEAAVPLDQYTVVAEKLRDDAKARLVNKDEGYCGDGEINGSEECDPQAVPNGCGLLLARCDDECNCVPIIDQ